MKQIIGIDPGLSGGIAVLSDRMRAKKMPDTYPEIFRLLSDIKDNSRDGLICILEDVGKGMPGQSSKATATFARHNGHLEMALFALGIPTEKVTPAKWMKFYSNSVGKSSDYEGRDWKKRLKQEALMLYPDANVTLYTADAILIAHYGKQTIK